MESVIGPAPRKFFRWFELAEALAGIPVSLIGRRVLQPRHDAPSVTEIRIPTQQFKHGNPSGRGRVPRGDFP